MGASGKRTDFAMNANDRWVSELYAKYLANFVKTGCAPATI
mgnify:CR=1 FL=1